MPKDTEQNTDDIHIPEIDGKPVDYDQLQKDLDVLAQKQKSISEATGDLRAAIKNVLDTRGYHKGALSVIRQIDAMSDAKLADFLRTFEPLFDVMLSKKWRDKAQNDMFDEGDGEE